MLYILLSGKPPFDGNTDNEITDQVKIGKYNITDGVWSKISEQAKSLIMRMMTYDFKQRLSAREALDDPWF